MQIKLFETFYVKLLVHIMISFYTIDGAMLVILKNIINSLTDSFTFYD